MGQRKKSGRERESERESRHLEMPGGGGLLRRTPRCWVSTSPSPDEWYHWGIPINVWNANALPLPPSARPGLTGASPHLHMWPDPNRCPTAIWPTGKTNHPILSFAHTNIPIAIQHGPGLMEVKALLLLPPSAFICANIIKPILQTPLKAAVWCSPALLPKLHKRFYIYITHYC